MGEEYRYECATLEGFLQRIVVLSQHGYRFFVQGRVPPRKEPEQVDEKILGKYELRKTRRQRAYRREQGLPNGHYFRHEADWVLMATDRRFIRAVDRNECISDLQVTPIRVRDYSISLRRDGSMKQKGEHRLRASVRIDRPAYLELRAHLLGLALHRSKERMEHEIWRCSSAYEAYAPVQRQFRAILARVNETRKRSGFERVPSSCIRIYRRHPRHFDCDDQGASRSAP